MKKKNQINPTEDVLSGKRVYNWKIGYTLFERK